MLVEIFVHMSLLNVLICGSFASFWFLQKQRLLSRKKETTIQSKETFIHYTLWDEYFRWAEYAAMLVNFRLLEGLVSYLSGIWG
jgi:hypothetical protein